MIKAIVENIGGFMDVYVFLSMLGIGIFGLAVDYPYFKRNKMDKDAKITKAISILYIIATCTFAIIARFE